MNLPNLLSGFHLDELDLTIDHHLNQVENLADQIIDQGYSLNLLEETDQKTHELNISLGAQLALKLALSKTMVTKISGEVNLSVVFAVYKEHQRILSKEKHPFGEDFLNKKIQQLQWLCSSNPQVNWNLIMVDDGCPEGTGKIAEDLLSQHPQKEKVEILYLQNAIDKGLLGAQPLSSTSDSQKGGAIEYGMWHAAQKSNKNHIIIFTDADLSTHLGQTGLLIDGIVHKNMLSAIGSRREKNSVVVKQGSRNDRGKLFIYLWKRLLPELNYIIDTQCGFKAFDAQIVDQISTHNLEKKFAFDIELLLKTEAIRSNAIQKTAIAWIDSEAASTTTDIQPYLPMLKSITAMYRKYSTPNTEANEFASFIESLDENSWAALLENIPEEITSREPIDFSDYNGVKVKSLKLKL